MEQITTALNNRSARLAHAYIISAASPESRREAAVHLSASLVCRADETPCGDCRDCHKAFAMIHPDIAFVSRAVGENGKQRREIYVEQIREIISGAYIMPNEAERKVYVIEDAEHMNIAAQNALLKILEDPPGGVAFILCTELSDSLLPTVKSRCIEIFLRTGEKIYSDETSILACEFAELWMSGKEHELFAFCAAHDGMSAELLPEFFECAKNEAVKRLRSGADSSAMELAKLLDKAALYAKHNVGTKHIFGMLSIRNFHRIADRN